MIIAFVFAAVMNFGSYWFSDKIVLRMYRAQQVGPEHPLYQMTERLAQQGGLPMPKVYIIPDAVAERVRHRPQSRRTRRWRRPKASCRSSASTSSKA